ncbi:hypothetical protein LY78DRAFT_664064 [Colletotrichum sublineola]|nr:hypothetical protein LY78DRAFT_664064 [Colletotrichum sublineola]
MASFAFGCTERWTGCSPLAVCNGISGTDVCGTQELADGPCTTTAINPQATDATGSVSCNCCPV